MKGVIASPHRLASEAGAQVLRAGGNAFDAIVAADAVLCVVYPHMTSIGGDLFALCWPAGRERPIGLAGAGRAGAGASIEAVRTAGYERMPERGAMTVTVPGTVQAWGRLVETYGRMGMGALMAPAVALARDGWEVTARVAEFLAASAQWRLQEPEQRRLLPPVLAGMALRNPDLAGVLEEIGRAGWLTFYRGAVAEAIVAALAARGGFITASDMISHRTGWVEPVQVSYRGLEVYQMPPPTQGLAAAAMLSRFDRIPAGTLSPGPGFAPQLVRVRGEAYALRDALISDPDFTDVPAEPFLNPDAAIAVPAPGTVPDGDTVYLCAADEEGNLVSMIQSVAFDFGSGVIAEGTGVVLQNRGAYFNLDPSHVNRLEPGKRTMHTLIPALAARDGRPWAAFGSMGGDGQPQLQTQVLMNLVDGGMGPAEAVAAPRIRVGAGGHELLVEADYPGAAEIARGAGGIPGRLMPPRHWQFGHAHAIVLDGVAGWSAGADPRSDGSVAEA